VSGKRDREARIAALEQLIQPRKPGRRTLDDACAEIGLSTDEMHRLVGWLLRLEERGRELSEPPDEQQELEAAAARWANCRFTHGPGLCKADCPGDQLGDRQDVAEGAPAEPESRDEELMEPTPA
jgi:hypothetical protein